MYQLYVSKINLAVLPGPEGRKSSSESVGGESWVVVGRFRRFSVAKALQPLQLDLGQNMFALFSGVGACGRVGM